MKRNTILITVYSKRDGIDVPMPAKWAICGACDGHATTSRHIECDGGGFTASEWAEQDDDFREDYLAGVYDRPCEACKGKGRIQEVDREAPLDWRQRVFLKAYDQQQRDNAEIDRIHAFERRMGA